MKTVSPKLNLPEIDQEILKFWKEDKTFQKSLDNRKDSDNYLFYDGPPFSSGLPHYGHLLVGTMKDIVPRYQTMNGKHVSRRFGWDTHGLPIEMIIEKKLELKGRTDILDYGVGKFNEACRDGVLSCVDEWEKVTNRLGRWVDFENDYKTMDTDFMESVWWVFKTLWDNGRIYEGTRSMPYSWRLSTPLSNFEANSNYKDVQDHAVTLSFKVKELDNTYILAWTTTPWTLPSNFALCMSKDIDYVVVKPTSEDKKYVLAKARLEAFFKNENDYEILEEKKGSEFEGLTYEPLFSYFKDEDGFKVVTDDYVSTTDGTGIVHTAPAHGEDDHRIGLKFKLPIIDPTDAEGNYKPEVKDFAGRNIKESEKDIIKSLKDAGKLFKHESIQHSYPFCERSDTPLMNKAISAWYVKVEDLQEEMLKNNEDIHWVPGHIKAGRFGKWLGQARDWNISRNRFWGNPMPVWKCENEDCDSIECLGSKKELEEKINQEVTDLHKHIVDDYTWDCEKCKSKMKRIPEVLDCWFESGSMPYAQLHYPFENEKVFNDSYPADFIIESLDQTRGWFYTLMVLASSIFKKAPFKNCVVTGMILAEDGRKMSKSLKNYPDPTYVLDEYGADALRLYLINSPLLKGENLRFAESGVKETVRSVFLPFWNVYSFFTTYAGVDGYKPSSDLTASTNPLDKWIISRFQTLVSNIENEMKVYQLYNVVPVLLEFLEELTNWYLRRSRRRFWSDDKQDKQYGYDTLYYVLIEFSKVLAPFLPFLTEEIYLNLNSLNINEKNSIHLEDYPKSNSKLMDSKLEADMALIQSAVTLGRALRSTVNIRTRQPLASITVVTKNEDDAKVLEDFSDHIKQELNVKEVKFSSNESDLVQVQVKPDFPTLGPIFGKQMKEFTALLKDLSSTEIESIEAGNDFESLGKTVPASAIKFVRKPKSDDLEIETANGVTVFYDTVLTESLMEEGLAREFINRVQRFRKEADFKISDRIKTVYKADEKLSNAIANNSDYIKAETLTLELEVSTEKNNDSEFKDTTDIEGVDVEIALSRIS